MMMCAVSLVVAAQFPNLPYNPDENGDGLIGVVDLQSFLAVYGNEFTNLLTAEGGGVAFHLSEDLLSWTECNTYCAKLPGDWQLVSRAIVNTHLDEMQMLMPLSTNGSDYWWNASSPENPRTCRWEDETTSNGGNIISWSNSSINSYPYQCMCMIEERATIEYFTCKASCSDGAEALDECVNLKALEGWLPLSTPSTQQVYNDCFWQPLWRWAE